ncbi:hypothetical protein SAMN05518849_11077 [Sphingobium sp. AP50]|nr:hypothetical protein SAMN05518849_11077 [Sphingobium sp. AP50]
MVAPLQPSDIMVQPDGSYVVRWRQSAPGSRSQSRYRPAQHQGQSAVFESLSAGLAPDTNINQATAADQVDMFGLPFEIDPSARRRSGVGILINGEVGLRESPSNTAALVGRINGFARIYLHLTRSSLHRCLQRCGGSCLRKADREKPKKFKAREFVFSI